MYSQFVKEGGPIPTSFAFKASKAYELIGEMTEPKGITIEDPVFQMTLKYFEKGAKFTQKIKLLSTSAKITGELEFMSCDDEKCLPPELLDFEFSVKGAASSEDSKAETTTESTPTITVSGDVAPAQNQGILTPVTWESKIVDLGDGVYELQATATIEEHWHLYSMELPRDDGPIATEYNILSPAGLAPIEKPTEKGDLIVEFDPNFDMDLNYYASTV